MSVVYIVKTADGWLAPSRTTHPDDTQLRIVESPEHALILSRLGSVRMAMVNAGQAFSYNTVTRKLRRVNA